jgi:penicillin-binding protein 2
MSRSSPGVPGREQRYLVLAGFALGGFLLIVAGLLRLQVLGHDQYRRLAQENRVRLEVLRAPRGAIYDRHGELLADNHPSFNVVFRPMPAESVTRAVAHIDSTWLLRVSTLVEEDTAQIRELVRFANRSGQTATLRRNAPFAMRAAIEETRAELPGIEVVIEPMRRYKYGKLAAHLLGYAGEITDAELDSLGPQGYRSGNLIGRSGVERSYEQVLRGRDGAEFVVVNAMGRRVSTLVEGPPQPPVAGHDLRLTLDLDIQLALEEAMSAVGRGAAVAIDPRDGGVLAMVSRPAFDPNEFAAGLSFRRWAELSKGGANPLLNRAIQGAYPPGSTFKIVTMLGALRAGVAYPGSRFAPCDGAWEFGGRVFGCWKRSGHGSLDFVGAMQHSCDTYFYQIGPRLGIDALSAAAKEFGLGARTGIDLPQERRGLVPDLAFYERRFGVGNMRKGTMLNLAIGQGEILVTPLQLALMAAEVATGGKPTEPHVVGAVMGVEERASRPLRAGVNAPATAWQAVRRGLEKVVDEGTGTASRVQGVRVAGKTGTAQNPHGEDHALFVCYAPADKPEIAMAFVIENSGHGGSIAAPMAGHVLQRLYLPDSLRQKPHLKPPPVDTSEVVRGD